jgi:hypothetical protein
MDETPSRWRQVLSRAEQVPFQGMSGNERVAITRETQSVCTSLIGLLQD